MKLKPIEIINVFYLLFSSFVVLFWGFGENGAFELLRLNILSFVIIIFFSYVVDKKILEGAILNKFTYKVLKFIRDWYFIGFCLVFYSHLPLMNKMIFGRYFDTEIIALERFIFGSLPALWFVDYFESPLLMELSHMGYFSYYLIIPTLGIPLYLKENKESFERYFFSIILAFLSCYLIYIVFPVSGPCYIFEQADVNKLSGYFFTNLSVAIHNSGSVRAAAFPSSHVTVAIVYLLYAREYSKKIYTVSIPVIGLLIFATFYAGYHFVVDAIAGVFMGYFIYAISKILFSKLKNQSGQ